MEDRVAPQDSRRQSVGVKWPGAAPTPTLGHDSRAVTMTDFAAHKRIRRQREMGGRYVRRKGRKRGGKVERSLRSTTDDDLPWKHSTKGDVMLWPKC